MISTKARCFTKRLWQKSHCAFPNSTALRRGGKAKHYSLRESSTYKSPFLSRDLGSSHEDTSLDANRMYDTIIKEMSLAQSSHYIRISLDAILNNLTILKSHCAPHTDVIAVVKANAYGHGSVGITHFLSQCGVDHFAVATAREGATLRFGGIKDTIIVFGNLTDESVRLTYRHGLVPVVSSVNSVDIWKSNLEHLDTKALAEYPLVIEVDTGLTRFGCHPDDLDKIVERCYDHGLTIHSVMNQISETWFNADESLRELDLFLKVTRSYREMGIKLHSSASGPTLHRMGVDLDFIRPGSALYGIPEMKREGHAATFGLGYADGFKVALSDVGRVSDLHGRLFQVIGYISMDAFVADVADDVTESSVFHILKDDYTSVNSIVGAAEKLGTTAREFSSYLCYRIPRVFTLRNKAQYVMTLDRVNFISA